MSPQKWTFSFRIFAVFVTFYLKREGFRNMSWQKRYYYGNFHDHIIYSAGYCPS